MILILIQSFFKVLITKDGGKIKVHLATDYKTPAILHWALSKTTPGEWLVSI